MVAASPAGRLIYLFDDNLLQDAAKITDLKVGTTEVIPTGRHDLRSAGLQASGKDTVPQPIALALTNALFKVTPPNGALLFGSLSEDYAKVESGFLFLTFGLFAYLPTLPDPYAANLGVLRRQVNVGASF